MDTMIPHVLIVVNDKKEYKSLSRIIKAEGMKVRYAPYGDKAVSAACMEKPDVVLLDLRMSGMNGSEVLKKIKGAAPDLPLVAVVALTDVRQAVGAIKAGAHDYLTIPFDNQEVLRVIRRTIMESESKQRLKSALATLNKGQDNKNSLLDLMGQSRLIVRLLTDVNRVALSNFTVVITGETGTGKELVAHAIHQASPRAVYPFVPVDCGSIPENLLESELFGHEKGSFTGADAQKKGKFETAQKGTLFMDEIANMPLGSQAKFLRVLQDKKLYHVGATKSVDIDIRIIAATNQDLQEMATEKQFRSDLFYRLNEFMIHVPPLRERPEDILYLTRRFLDAANLELGKHVTGVTDDAMERLLAYQWPGNVRQLRTTIRGATLAASDIVTKDLLNLPHAAVTARNFTGFSLKTPEVSWKDASLSKIISQGTVAVEKEVIREVLTRTGGNKAKAARILHVDYKTIYNKVKKYEISLDN